MLKPSLNPNRTQIISFIQECLKLIGNQPLKNLVQEKNICYWPVVIQIFWVEGEILEKCRQDGTTPSLSEALITSPTQLIIPPLLVCISQEAQRSSTVAQTCPSALSISLSCTN